MSDLINRRNIGAVMQKGKKKNMKLDENSINAIAIKNIGDIVENMYAELERSDCCDNTRIAMLGEINGMVNLASDIKDALKEEEQ